MSVNMSKHNPLAAMFCLAACLVKLFGWRVEAGWNGGLENTVVT